MVDQEIHNKYHCIDQYGQYNTPFIFVNNKKIEIISTSERMKSFRISDGKGIYKTNIEGLYEVVTPKTKHSGLDSHGELYTILTSEEIETEYGIEQPFQYEVQ
jgi:hypothetical protein